MPEYTPTAFPQENPSLCRNNKVKSVYEYIFSNNRIVMPDSPSPCRKETEGVIKFSGALDVYRLDDIYNCLKDSLLSGQDLTLDCLDIKHMDTAAIQIFITFRRSFPKEYKLTFINIPPALEQAWEIIGVKQVILKE